MTLHSTAYKHWDGHHLGIWRRRAVIASAGLRGSLQSKWMRHIITACWMLGLGLVAWLFLIGQLLIPNSLIVRLTGDAGGPLKDLANMLIGWLTDHPEISVHTTQNLLFFFCCKWLLPISIIAIALAMPHLITRDLSSNAIIIYSSKAVTRFDYLLGKFSMVIGLLVLTWLGPMCLGWFLGNLLAPNWGFFWHSRAALFNTCIFAVCSMMILSVLALGVSAAATKEKSTVSLWIAFWLLGNAFIPLAMTTGKSWLKFLSFRYDLDQLALAVFRLSNDLQIAQDNVPVLGSMLQSLKRGPNSVWHPPETAGALCALAIMLLICVVILVKRVKPE
jgi:ABC-2 type transport system permease protein